MQVAVLGLGRMGSAIAGRLIDQGYEVVLWNRSLEKAEQLERRGARRAPSAAAAAAEAEVVVTSLADDQAVLTVVMDEGVVGALRTDGVLMDTSTVSPSTSRHLADLVAGRFADVPILGGPQLVASGEATLLVGGEEPALSRLRPVLASITTKQWRCGGTGTGATCKLVANLMMMSGLGVLAEAVSLAQGAGLGDDVVSSLMDSALVPPLLKSRVPYLVQAEYQGWFSVDLGFKDVRLATALAAEHGQRLPLGQAIVAMLEQVQASGLGALDIAAIREALSIQ